MMLARIKFMWQLTRPRGPEQVAATTYRRHAYRGRHRYVEPQPEPPIWRTLKLGWQAYIRPIPITEVFT